MKYIVATVLILAASPAFAKETGLMDDVYSRSLALDTTQSMNTASSAIMPAEPVQQPQPVQATQAQAPAPVSWNDVLSNSDTSTKAPTRSPLLGFETY